MDLMPDISVTMATMATNHLWMSLSGRLARYLKWKHPELSVAMRKTVVMMVTKFPKMPLDKVDQLCCARDVALKCSAKTSMRPY